MLDDALQKGATIVEGGYRDAANRLIAPTILTGITTEMRLMEEEIFGPLLPVIPYSRLDDALAFVNSRPKPLAFYIFSQQEGTIQTILASTSAGGTCINDTLLHFVHPELPFGGVNHSGMGRSHGHFGFLTFSNERAVLHQRAPQSPIKLLYPPFTKRTRTLIDYLLKYF
jgi:aldehyde dehydrogenase (NAD+)